MKQGIILIVVLGIVGIIVSCLSPYNGGEKEDGLPVSGAPIVISDLFKSPENGQPGDTRFYTNDPIYRRSSGYTLWAYNSDTIDFQERTVSLRKTIGSSIAGYGVIICSDLRKIDDRSEIVFLTVMLNNNRQYAVGKVIGASYEPLVYWTNSSNIIQGYGIWNTIRIVKDSENPNKYDLYINGKFERFFVDAEQPLTGGTGRNGYVVVIAPDDLNQNAVEVWFEEL